MAGPYFLILFGSVTDSGPPAASLYKAWPAALVPVSYSFYLQPNTLQPESPITRKRRTVRLLGSRWMCEMTFNLRRPEAQILEALLDTLSGPSGKVLLSDPDHIAPLGTNLHRDSTDTFFSDNTTFTDATGFNDGGAPGIWVYDNWEVGAEQIMADGFPLNTTQLLAGDNVGLNGWMYRLTRDAVADDSGRADLYLNRPLRAALEHRMDVVRDRPTSPFSLKDDDQARRQRQGDQPYVFNLSFQEAL